MTNINKSSKKTATSFELKKKDQIIFHIRFLLMTNINKSSKKRATSFELKKDPIKMHDLLMNKSVLKMEIQFSMYDLFNNEEEKGF